MAIEIQNYPNATPPSADYPSGDITDAAPGVLPTPVNADTNGDIQQFFAKIMREAGLAYSGDRDNTTNGWQFYQALQIVTKGLWETASEVSLNGLTATFENNKSTIITGGLVSSTVDIDYTGARPGCELWYYGVTIPGRVITFNPLVTSNLIYATGTASLTMANTNNFAVHIKYLGGTVPTVIISVYNLS